MTSYADIATEARAFGLDPKTVSDRIKSGLSLYDAVRVDPFISAASRRTKIPLRVLVERIKSMSLDQAIEVGPENGHGPTVDALKQRRRAGDTSVRRSAVRSKSVVEIAQRAGLSKQRVSTLLSAGVKPDDIRRTLAKKENHRERVNKETALEHQRQANLCWLWCFLAMLGGKYVTTEAARSYERTALWWSERK